MMKHTLLVIMAVFLLAGLASAAANMTLAITVSNSSDLAVNQAVNFTCMGTTANASIIWNMTSANLTYDGVVVNSTIVVGNTSLTVFKAVMAYNIPYGDHLFGCIAKTNGTKYANPEQDYSTNITTSGALNMYNGGTTNETWNLVWGKNYSAFMFCAPNRSATVTAACVGNMCAEAKFNYPVNQTWNVSFELNQVSPDTHWQCGAKTANITLYCSYYNGNTSFNATTVVSTNLSTSSGCVYTGGSVAKGNFTVLYMNDTSMRLLMSNASNAQGSIQERFLFQWFNASSGSIGICAMRCDNAQALCKPYFYLNDSVGMGNITIYVNGTLVRGSTGGPYVISCYPDPTVKNVYPSSIPAATIASVAAIALGAGYVIVRKYNQ